MDDIKNLNGGVSGDPGEAPRAVTVGTFDGLHRGHVAVLSRLVQQAFAAGLQPTMITFQPHPLQLINPEKAPLLLSDTAAKCHAAESLGIDVALVPFGAHEAHGRGMDGFPPPKAPRQNDRDGS